MSLPVVPLDSPNERQHRTVIATSLNELVKFFNTISSASWTPTIRGSGTAGTYEVAANSSRCSRIGRRVFLDINLTLAAVVTGGGTGRLQITGLPFKFGSGCFSTGQVRLSGVDVAAATISLALLRDAVDSVRISEVHDDAAATDLAVSGLAANDNISASICYETDDL